MLLWMGREVAGARRRIDKLRGKEKENKEIEIYDDNGKIISKTEVEQQLEQF